LPALRYCESNDPDFAGRKDRSMLRQLIGLALVATITFGPSLVRAQPLTVAADTTIVPVTWTGTEGEAEAGGLNSASL